MIACTCRTSLTLLSRVPTLRTSTLTARRTFTSTSSTLEPPTPTSPPAAESSSVSISSCPEGTVLKGLNYLKDESPILSKPDQEYPTWLWSLASAEASTEGGGGAKKASKSKSGARAADGVDAEYEKLKRQKKSLKMEGRKAIKASNALRG